MNQRMQGYIALISIIIISALLLLVASFANLFSIGESQMGLEESQSWQAFYLAAACAEEALMSLKEDTNYQGSETLIFDNGTCDIMTIGGSGNEDRTIDVLGRSQNSIRKIKVEVEQVNPEMVIRLWKEVPDF